MHLFYAPTIQNEVCLLSPDESLHCTKVLRLQVGEEVLVTDGIGNMYLCTLESLHPKGTTARIVKFVQSAETTVKERKYIHIAVAPTKNIERLEWFLEKATELGISEISFIFCAHSERNTIKTERLQKILVSAMKQSQQAYLPILNEPVKYKDFLKKIEEKNSFSGSAQQKFIAYCGNEYPKKDLFTELQKPVSYLLLVGPEGDFSPEEVAQATQLQCLPVSLGNTRLRTETAALYGVFVGNVYGF
ncbi:MAG: RsmE family RNA methyltransferase [Bacteroidales bacterium]